MQRWLGFRWEADMVEGAVVGPCLCRSASLGHTFNPQYPQEFWQDRSEI